MQLSRREVINLIGASAVTAVFSNLIDSGIQAGAPQAPRLPLDEFVQSPRLLAALRKGVLEMKRRKPSDPLSWFYQAAIHGVTDAAIEKAVKDDPLVGNVFRKRYWNQCPHDGENSANFLPWHRGYTYHFEKILRMHTGEAEFSLPYWNYHDPRNRKFPREFGIQHLDGNLENNSPDNINPLFLEERDFYFTSYEHPFATGLPLLELSESAVDISLPMSSPVFFGITEREGIGGGIADEDPSTRGLLESYPHDHIHRSVGGIVTSPTGETSLGAMATPPTAGFDPIFPIHHSNIDRLWAEWSCMPGKQWGQLPSNYWFNERPWYFFDIDGTVVNVPRKDYFDHRALGVHFKNEDMTCKPLALPETIDPAADRFAANVSVNVSRRVEFVAQDDTAFSVTAVQRAVIRFRPGTMQRLRAPMTTVRGLTRVGGAGTNPRLFLRLRDVRLGAVEATGFDVHVTSNVNGQLTRASASFVGSIALFRHAAGDARHGGNSTDDTASESFDISKAVAASDNANLDQLSLVFVPYSLLTVPGRNTVFPARNFLTVRGVDFLMIQ